MSRVQQPLLVIAVMFLNFPMERKPFCWSAKPAGQHSGNSPVQLSCLIWPVQVAARSCMRPCLHFGTSLQYGVWLQASRSVCHLSTRARLASPYLELRLLQLQRQSAPWPLGQSPPPAALLWALAM